MNDQEIEQAYGRPKKAERRHPYPDPQPVQVYKPSWWLAFLATVALAVLGISGFIWLVWASQTFSDAGDGVKFVTEGAIALALFLVAAIQACLYWSQRAIMNAQSSALTVQADAARHAAYMATGQLVAMQHQEQAQDRMLEETVRQNEAVLKAMQSQSEAMTTSLALTGQTVKATQGQLDAMKSQVELAGKQTELTAKQISLMIENERAYIGVRRMKLIGLDERIKELAVQVIFRNGGKSPAFKFRAYCEVSIGSAPKPFTWKEIVPDIKRDFIPRGEDRSIVVPYFGMVNTETVTGSSPTNTLFIDGEAHYRTLGGKEIILCFGGTYYVSENIFEARYQHERIDLEIQDSIHGHTADNITLVRGKPEANEGNKNGGDNKGK